MYLTQITNDFVPRITGHYNILRHIALLLNDGTDELKDIDHVGRIRQEPVDVNHRE